MNQIIQNITLNQIDYTIIISYNFHHNEKSPITIYINQLGNQIMGDYIYTIDKYSTYIKESTINSDQIKSLNQLLVKKYNVPVYLNINGELNCSNVEIFQKITQLIKI